VAVAMYRVGTRAMDTLRRVIILPFQDASFAAFSRLHGNEAIVSAYVRLNRAAATATFPLFLGATTIAAELTVILFGEKYAATGQIFAMLALAGIPNTIIMFAASAFMAAGQPRLGTITNAALLGMNIVFVLILMRVAGPSGAAIGNLAALTLATPVVLLLLRHHLGLRVGQLVRVITPPALLSSAMTAILWIIKIYALPPMSDAAEVLAMIAAGGLLYVALFALWGRSHLQLLFLDLEPLLPGAFRDRLVKIRGRS
jgi:O-antigen/teichoic acid export membrane protein